MLVVSWIVTNPCKATWATGLEMRVQSVWKSEECRSRTCRFPRAWAARTTSLCSSLCTSRWPMFSSRLSWVSLTKRNRPCYCLFAGEVWASSWLCRRPLFHFQKLYDRLQQVYLYLSHGRIEQRNQCFIPTPSPPPTIYRMSYAVKCYLLLSSYHCWMRVFKYLNNKCIVIVI